MATAALKMRDLSGRIELDIIHYFKNIIPLTFKVLYCIHLQGTLRQKGDDGYSGLKDA